MTIDSRTWTGRYPVPPRPPARRVYTPDGKRSGPLWFVSVEVDVTQGGFDGAEV